MSLHLPPIRMTGAKVLLDGALSEASLTVEQGRIGGGAAKDVDLNGYWLLPGIIDLHGDGYERHLLPRPTARFPLGTSLEGVDRELAANGVTTAYLAQSWSWEGGVRSEDFAEDVMAALDQARPRLICDIRLQMRYETHMTHSEERFLAAVRRHGVDYVVFNNHIPGTLAKAETMPEAVLRWAAAAGWSVEEFMASVHEAAAREGGVEASLKRLAAAFDGMSVAYGSHDDADADARRRFHAIGARIAEFPISLEAAEAAFELKNPILMGAPNVARGGSQSGGASAVELIERGLCDTLVSDYHYPALQLAAWRLADEGVLPIADAWALISSGPAQALKFSDRGTLESGARADIVVMNPDTRRIEATLAGGRIAFLSGEVARRFISAEADLKV
ncbi:MAG: alpha-D-ribose 1-methylphosphonate 5-triphosphate diphosphatase [Pseudomonadota bacterium]